MTHTGIRTDIQRSAWRRFAVPAGAIAAAAVLAGCGSGSANDGAAASQPTSSDTAAEESTAGAETAEAETIGTAQGDVGTYLTGDDGRAVYLWVADSGGKSACSGACASVWPPVLTDGAPKAAQSAVAADLGTLTRSDGTTQVTYKGHPLYYFASDTEAGQTAGQGSDGFGAKWWLLTPTGAAITGDDSGGDNGGDNGGASTTGGSDDSGGGGGRY